MRDVDMNTIFELMMAAFGIVFVLNDLYLAREVDIMRKRIEELEKKHANHNNYNSK